MSLATDRFRELALQVQPIDAELAPIKLEMVQLSGEISLELLAEAFPAATILRVRTVSEVTPSDGGKKALQAVQLLKEHGVAPLTIIHDQARSIIWACVEPIAKVLPEKANAPSTEELLRRLAWAGMNYLDWKAHPSEFIDEPLRLLYDETRAALEALTDPDAKAQLRGLLKAWPEAPPEGR